MKTLALWKKSATQLLELLEMKIAKALQPLMNIMDETLECSKAEIAAVRSDPSSAEEVQQRLSCRFGLLVWVFLINLYFDQRKKRKTLINLKKN